MSNVVELLATGVSPSQRGEGLLSLATLMDDDDKASCQAKDRDKLPAPKPPPVDNSNPIPVRNSSSLNQRETTL